MLNNKKQITITIDLCDNGKIDYHVSKDQKLEPIDKLRVLIGIKIAHEEILNEEEKVKKLFQDKKI